MKHFVVLFFIVGFVGLVACQPHTYTEQERIAALAQVNKTSMTQTAWCAEHNNNNDGSIGAFVFAANGEGKYVSWMPATQKVNFTSSGKWVMKGDLLQMGTQIDSPEGERVSFSTNESGLPRMTWTTVSTLSEVNGRVSYVAIPCVLPQGI